MITDFVAAVAARVPGQLYLTLHPDPYPGHLFERAGLDLAVLDELVDAFVVPLCDRSYETTDWLEITMSGSRARSTALSRCIYPQRTSILAA